LESLKDDSANYDKYLKLVSYLAVDRKSPSDAIWSNTWRGILIDIVTSLSGITPPNDHAFLHYQEQIELAGNHKNTRSNTQTVEGGGRKVNIRLGSIHSVKGETHTATLVLDTCLNRSHHFKKIFPWIKGKPKKTVSDPDENRLKLHYVAMTRPSHLLCLAIKKSTLEKDGSINQKAIDELKSHGWGKVAVVDIAGNCEWL
jgi:DNA helicase-2/ATP-dependent DNA helicase PcrA